MNALNVTKKLDASASSASAAPQTPSTLEQRIAQCSPFSDNQSLDITATHVYTRHSVDAELILESSKTFIEPLTQLLKKYDCPVIDAIQCMYPKFHLLWIAYALIYLQIFKSAKKTVPEFEQHLITLSEDLLIFHKWKYIGNSSRDAIKHSLSLDEIIKSWHIELKALNLTQFLADLKSLNKLSVIQHELKQISPSKDLWLSAVSFVEGIVYKSIPILEMQANYRFQITSRYCTEVQSSIKTTSLKSSGANKINDLATQLTSLQAYTINRLKHLKHKSHPTLWNQDNFHQKTIEFAEVFVAFEESLSRRIQRIHVCLTKLHIGQAVKKKDSIEIATTLCLFRCFHAFNALHDAMTTLNHCLLELISDSTSSDEIWLINGSNSLSEILIASLDLLKQALQAKTTQEKVALLQELETRNAHITAQCGAQFPKWILFHQRMSQYCQHIYETITRKQQLDFEELMAVIPSEFHYLLNTQFIDQFFNIIKNAVNSLYNKQLRIVKFDDVIRVFMQFILNFEIPTSFLKDLTNSLIKKADKLNNSFISNLQSILKDLSQDNHQNYTQKYFFVLVNAYLQLGSEGYATHKLFGITAELSKLHENVKGFHTVYVHILSHPFRHLPKQPEQDNSWLDEIDIEEDTLGLADPEEVEKENYSSLPALDTNAATQLKTVTLPATLPTTSWETIGLFRTFSSQYYSLTLSDASPLAIQKLPPSEFPIRQQLFALYCLQTIVELRTLSTAPQHLCLLNSLFFVWEHQAVEQNATHYIKQLRIPGMLPHQLSRLMTMRAIKGEHRTLTDNNDATRYYRYPFANYPNQTSLALQHIRDAVFDKATASFDVNVWLKDMLVLLRSSMSHIDSSKMQSDFSEALEKLIEQVGSIQGTEKIVGLKKSYLSTDQKDCLHRALSGIDGYVLPMGKLINKITPAEPYYHKKIATLKTILHHLRCLSIAIDLFKNFPHRKFLFMYALIQQISAQYLAESIGVYLSLSMQDPHYTHDLMVYCHSYQLNVGLSNTQNRLLESINLRKGSEYVIKRFPPKTDKLPYARMMWLNTLYEQSNLEEVSAQKSQKSLDTSVLQQQLVNASAEISDLSKALLSKII